MSDRVQRALQASMQHRHSRRRQHHDAAHAEPAAQGGKHFDLLTTSADVAAACDKLRAAGAFAYDTEFIGELSYRPRLCVVQLASVEDTFLIDAQADGLDLAPLWALLADESLTKLAHAGEQDLEIAWRLGPASGPRNVLDLQIAAGFCGLGYPLSLAKLVEATVGRKLSKGFTFTDWSRRPLSRSQLAYAAEDVVYLPAAWDVLRGELEARGWADAFFEETHAATASSSRASEAERLHLRVRGVTGLDVRATEVLIELAAWRDRTARAADVPPRTLMKDETIIDLARRQPRTPDKLDGYKYLPRPVVEAHGAELIAAIGSGIAQAAGKPRGEEERAWEPTPREKFRIDALWARATAELYARGVDPQLVANRAEVVELIRAADGAGEVEGSPLMRGWRRGVVGEPLVSAARGSV